MTGPEDNGGREPRNPAQPDRALTEQPRISQPHRDPDRDIVYGASYTLSDEEAQRSFDEEDARWSAGNQLRDWLYLLVALLLWAAWTLAIYFIEPGLR
jgi:hypothetical protein